MVQVQADRDGGAFGQGVVNGHQHVDPQQFGWGNRSLNDDRGFAFDMSFDDGLHLHQAGDVKCAHGVPLLGRFDQHFLGIYN